MYRKRHRSESSDEENRRNNLEKRLEKLEKENRRLKKKKKRRKHRRRERSTDSETDSSSSTAKYHRRTKHSRTRSVSAGGEKSDERSELADRGEREEERGDKTAPLVDSTNTIGQKSSSVDAAQSVKPIEPESSTPEDALSPEILNILGKRICEERVLAPPVPSDLVVRCEDIIKQGLTDELKAEILKKYPPPRNCISIDPAKLNSEFKTVVQDLVIKRDERIRKKQEKISAALALSMQAMSFVAVKEKDNPEMLTFIQQLYELTQLLADLQHDESLIRRSLIIANINASLRDTVNETPCGEFLFGNNLEEALKTAKTMESSVKDLKVIPKPQQTKQTKNSNPPPRRHPGKNFSATSGGQKPRYQPSQKKQQQSSQQKSRYQKRDQDRDLDRDRDYSRRR